ncbi:M1 family metallopeptidase [Saprospiraceae bacterium]|nr:M1 family metallopeptidase [Saprospiraceae bacterium]
MSFYHALLRTSLFLVSFGFSILMGQGALSPRIANYNMDISLDVDNKMLTGKTVLVWRNISDVDIDELYFHLYYNAFRNTESTFFTERGVPGFLTQNIDDNCGWGWSEIINIEDQDHNDLSALMSYVSPDDNNAEDKSVLKVKLQTSVKAGETATFIFDWKAKIPQTMPRTGYNMDFYFLAQWFPKLGVLEPAGMRFVKDTQWNCHQYHSSGEYYSDFGVYEVNLTVPLDYEVAASGELIGQTKNDSMRTWTYRATDVIDFTWTASPHFVKQESAYKDTRIMLYTYPDKAHFGQRYFDAIQHTMEYLDSHLGPYPYSTLSIIDPPLHGMFTGGMEYPTLITSLNFNSFPTGFKGAETLVTHEFIHQYFMQMVATNETEEPWMDEGITTYYENRILDAYMGKRESFIDFAGIKIGSKEYNRVELFSSDNVSVADNTLKSWEYENGGYKEVAYNKTALWLQTLEGIVGTELMDEIMKSYFQRWKFKHPCRHDFIDVVNEVVIEHMSYQFPDGMDWYFDQVLYGTDICDYELSEIREIPVTGERGFFSDLDECEVKGGLWSDSIYTNIIVKRNEGLRLPVEIEVNYENGDSEMYYWDGQSRVYSIKIASNSKVISAEIDPDRKIYIDHDFINNSMAVDQSKKGLRMYMAKWTDALMHGLELMTMLI